LEDEGGSEIVLRSDADMTIRVEGKVESKDGRDCFSEFLSFCCVDLFEIDKHMRED
jgi:hypothetical protein